MTTELRSLHTRYAGCHFRSRLEARWAVFFERAGIEWEYEPQGYTVSRRITNPWADDTFNYLPDFWLPSAGVFVEVKGSLTDKETLKVYDAAASLSENGHDTLLLGSLTRGTRYGNPVRLHFHEGQLIATCFWCANPTGRHVVMAEDNGNVDVSLAGRLLAGFACQSHSLVFGDALDAARSARFEFGRRG